MKGQLSEQPLAELIREISAARFSGALRLARERARALVYFDGGAVVDARSNLRLHRLPESLRRWGVVTEDQLTALSTEGMSDAQFVAMLAGAGVLSADELPKLRARQAADVLRPLLLWTNGTWSFDPRARAEAGAGLATDARQLLMESARRLPAELIADRLARPDEKISPVPEMPEGLEPLPVEAFVLSRVDAPLSLGELVAVSGLPEAETRRAIYALMLGGLLVRENWPQAISAEMVAQALAAPQEAKAEASSKPRAAEEATVEVKPDAPPADPQEEINVLLERASAETHYEALGVSRSASSAEVKRAYYALAKRFHPDRFHRDANAELRTRIANAFARIAQAYEVLKDASQRAAYDLKLASAPRAPAAEKKAPTEDRASPPSASSAASPPASPNQSPQYRAEDYFQQGLSAQRDGNRALASFSFGEAVRLAPRQPRYHASYGRVLAGDPATRRQAEAEFKAAIALDERNASYRVMLAELYRDLGMHRRAEGELQRALSIAPQDKDARRLLDALRNG